MDPLLKSWRRRILVSTWLTYAGMYFCRKPFYVVKANLGEAYGLDASMLGQIGAAYLIAYTIGQFISGWAGTRWGPRIILLIGMALTAGCNIAFGFANTYAMFMLFMVINGLGQSTGWSNTVGTMASWFHRGERGAIMGLWTTNYTVGGVLAKVMAAFLLGALGFQYSFFGGCLVMMAVWLFFLWGQRNRPEDVGLPPVEDPPEYEANKPTSGTGSPATQLVITVLLMGSFYFFIKFIRYALWSWAPYFLKLNYGLEGDEAGYVSVLFDIGGVAGVIFAGWASDRFFQSRRARISFLLLIAMTLSCVVMYLYGATATWLFATSMGLVGFTLYGPDSLITGAGAIDVGSKRAATMVAGAVNGMGSLGSVVQDLVIGDLYQSSDGDLGPIFILLMLSAACATLLMGALLWRNRTGASDL